MEHKQNFNFLQEDDFSFDFELQEGEQLAFSQDDSWEEDSIKNKLMLLERAMTTIGGEVDRLRVDIKEVREHNTILMQTMERLKEVIQSKGILDLDDFNLACEVLDHSPSKIDSFSLKKNTH